MPRTVVLIGAGHAHLYVASRATELIRRGARIVLIDPGRFWYSGLATGVLGGQYRAADDQIDPEALITRAGGEFIRDQVVSVDPQARRLQLAGGDELPYDYLSVNVGSHVRAPGISGMNEENGVWPVKPVENLYRLRQYLEARFGLGQTPAIVVVGGGATGCEVAANLRALGRRHDVDLAVTLTASSDRLIAHAPAGASRALHRKLLALGVDVQLGTRIARRNQGVVATGHEREIKADIVVLATGLAANKLTQAMALPADPAAGLQVNGQLQSVADARVFAAGDCANMRDFNLPNLGVFGVRQAQYIFRNLVASLDAEPLASYRPQRRYLAILNLGDGTALATWGPLWWLGAGSMRLKHRIDYKFLRRYRVHQPPGN